MLITAGLEEVQLMVDHTVRRLVPIHCGSVRLEVTSVPAVLTKLCFLQKQILDTNKELEKLKPILVNYSERVAKKEKINPATIAQVQTVARTYKEKQEEIVKVREEFVKLHEEIQLETDAKVNVKGSVYQGASITISDVSYNVKGTVSHSKFVKKQGEIVVKPL